MVDAHVAAVFARLTRAEAAARLRAANTAYGFVNDVAAFARHPALRRAQVATPNGPVSVAAPPVMPAMDARELGSGPGDRRAFGGDPRGVRGVAGGGAGSRREASRISCQGAAAA